MQQIVLRSHCKGSTLSLYVTKTSSSFRVMKCGLLTSLCSCHLCNMGKVFLMHRSDVMLIGFSINHNDIPHSYVSRHHTYQLITSCRFAFFMRCHPHVCHSAPTFNLSIYAVLCHFLSLPILTPNSPKIHYNITL